MPIFRRSLAALTGMALQLASPSGATGESLLDAPPAAAMPTIITPSLSSRRDEAYARRERNGHFYFDTAVNGVPLQMMFDTGASRISLRAEDAARAGIDVSALSYTLMSRTANGVAEVAPAMIRTLTVGNITRQNVPAIVARPGVLNVNLLGQSFLARVAGYSLDGDQLVLKGGG